MHRYLIEEVSLADVREFVETHHYSKSVGGITPSHCFRIMFEQKMFGAAIFGRPAMKQTIDRYSENGTVNMVELRRFVMVDEAPRNSESQCLSVMLRILRKKGVERILSYSDPNYGHVGTIYKALGFRCLGQTSPINVVWYRDRRFPIRNVDQYRKWSTRSINRYQNWEDKSEGLFPYAQELRKALQDGTAVRKREAGKFIYLLELKPRNVLDYLTTEQPLSALKRCLGCSSGSLHNSLIQLLHQGLIQRRWDCEEHSGRYLYSLAKQAQPAVSATSPTTDSQETKITAA